MDRVIKFRAFYKGQMYPVVKLYLGKAKQGVGIDIDGVWFDLYLEEVELMQFTGLVDKNGREIYEGDVINWAWGNHYKPEVVRWHPGICGFAPFCQYNVDRDGTPTVEEHQQVYEIIGNIYENPELVQITPLESHQ